MCIVSHGALALYPDWPTETLGGKQPGRLPVLAKYSPSFPPGLCLPVSWAGGDVKPWEKSANLLCAWEQSGQHLSKAALSSE